MYYARCPWCDLMISDWKKDPTCNGEEITLEKLNKWHSEGHTRLGKKVLKGKGIIEEPQWNISPEWFIIPVLHIMIGMVNDLWVFIRSFIDNKIELVSEEEQRKRVEKVELSEVYDSLHADYNQFKEEREAEEKQIKKDLRETKKTITAVNNKLKKKRITIERKVELRSELNALTTLVKNLEKEVDEPMKRCVPKKATVDEAKKNLDKVKEELKKFVEERDGDANGMEVYLEQVLKQDGNIYIDAFFGRKMNGVCSGRLLDNHETIMNHVEEKCKERRALARNIERACSVDELSAKIKQFKKLFKLLKALFGYLRICGPTDDEKNRLKLVVEELYKYWREAGLSETVKVHVIVGHAVKQYIKCDGVADKAEDYLEKSHQEGKKLDNLTARMPQGFETKQRTQIKEWTLSSNPHVRKQVEKVNRGAKRKFKGNRKKTKVEVKREDDKNERDVLTDAIGEGLRDTNGVTWEEILARAG